MTDTPDIDLSKFTPYELMVFKQGGSYSSWGVRRKSPESSPADLAKQQRRKRKRNREAQRAYRERHSEAMQSQPSQERFDEGRCGDRGRLHGVAGWLEKPA
jgi:hypothetical protein